MTKKELSDRCPAAVQGGFGQRLSRDNNSSRWQVVLFGPAAIHSGCRSIEYRIIEIPTSDSSQTSRTTSAATSAGPFSYGWGKQFEHHRVAHDEAAGDERNKARHDESAPARNGCEDLGQLEVRVLAINGTEHRPDACADKCPADSERQPGGDQAARPEMIEPVDGFRRGALDPCQSCEPLEDWRAP